DFDDPLADLLDDLPIEDKNEPKIPKKAPPEKSRDELTFDDDEDDLMNALGFGESPKESPKKNETVSSELPQRARTRLDEILGRGTSPRLLERPPTGERKDPPQQQEKQKHHQETPTTKDPFLEEDLTFGSYQPTLVTTPEGRHSRRQSVRFSTEDNSASSPEKKLKPITPTTLTPTFPRPAADWLGLSQDDEEEPPPVPEPLKTPSSSSVGSKPSSSGNHIPQPSTETPNTSFKYSKPVGPSVEVSASQKHEDDWLSGALSRKKTQSSTRSEEKRTTQEDFLGFGDEVDLESSLQQELDQNQMLLESVQQRHKQDTELMENTHRARVKLLDDSAAQREARARQECEDLAERLATVTRIAEQERMELQAKHQRRLAQTQQDRDREVERLRDLQRKSILEMKKDHEDQVQRLKRLKDEEIDAVTSATSQTRSLTVVIEQMEHFSHRLGDLSSRVESTHENTAQGLEQGARQRDEQLRVMQDRLGQQQRAMAEERTRLKEVIAKMDTQLAEQQRQLEKERWRVNAEQAKADSSQRGLDEERRSLTQHISMEREELERAKSALLEEQQQVMQRCAEERRKLAAEWTQFHTQEKQRQDRAEREASRALERDAHREGSIISMAQEQVDLKLRAGELKQHEAAVAREREALERQREELDREKERLSGTGLQLKTRAQEVEAFSKLASEKYNEGEKALQESRQVETEHQTRLRSIHSQMERLRQQEQHLHQDRDFLQDEQFFLDTLKKAPYNSAFHTD
uniref:Fas-binding factor 1 C-terminal domain-containing protein n=1 Tax=Oncorhynchus mykiss TaxID=8022 RepID=A0A8C7S3L5_ONCMY